ncbi:uncharacterized protein LOC120446120 [Drosophila santomea]|uniref:uncharacterized protein LOC120446120 n=1 Tax=Drosophila santomea TaxID=129105 RepID=UPI001952CEF2|nr:uncharacterized protein LOC120446120 [Drosophila santomea]
MSEDAPSDGPSAGEGADDPKTTTTVAPVDTTTAGARMMMIHPWLTAAAVAVYATKVMWVKFREIGVAKQKKKLLKNQKAQQSKSLQDIDEEDSELESEAEDDDVPQQLEGAASICQRSIEVAPADC